MEICPALVRDRGPFRPVAAGGERGPAAASEAGLGSPATNEHRLPSNVAYRVCLSLRSLPTYDTYYTTAR